MALEAQDNPFPYVTLVDTADPSTPAAGTKRLWVDTDDVLKIIDEADVVSTVGGGFTGDAGDIPFTPAAGIAATDVQAAIVEDAGDLAAHIADGTAAHAASAIAFTPNGSIAATDVQAAIQEVRDEASGGGIAGKVPIQEKEAVSGSGGTTLVVTMGSTPTNGNLLILSIHLIGTVAISSVASTNTTWTKLAGSTSGTSPLVEVWKGVVAASAGTAITITFASSVTNKSAFCSEWNGITGTLDQSATRTASALSAASNYYMLPVIKPTSSAALVYGVVGTTNGTTIWSPWFGGLTTFETMFLNTSSIRGNQCAGYAFPGTVARTPVLLGYTSGSWSAVHISLT